MLIPIVIVLVLLMAAVVVLTTLGSILRTVKWVKNKSLRREEGTAEEVVKRSLRKRFK